MSVRIRLRRIGRKKQPSYRLVVTDSATPRDGAYLDAVGFYNPRMQPAELRLDLDRVDAWLGRGADMSDTVASLVRAARRGGDAKIALKPVGGEPRPAADVAPPAPAPADAAATAAAAPSAEAAPPAASQAEEVGTAVAEAPDASAEPRREAGSEAAEPSAAEPPAAEPAEPSAAEPADAEPPE